MSLRVRTFLKFKCCCTPPDTQANFGLRRRTLQVKVVNQFAELVPAARDGTSRHYFDSHAR